VRRGEERERAAGAAAEEPGQVGEPGDDRQRGHAVVGPRGEVRRAGVGAVGLVRRQRAVAGVSGRRATLPEAGRREHTVALHVVPGPHTVAQAARGDIVDPEERRQLQLSETVRGAAEQRVRHSRGQASVRVRPSQNGPGTRQRPGRASDVPRVARLRAARVRRLLRDRALQGRVAQHRPGDVQQRHVQLVPGLLPAGGTRVTPRGRAAADQLLAVQRQAQGVVRMVRGETVPERHAQHQRRHVFHVALNRSTPPRTYFPIETPGLEIRICSSLTRVERPCCPSGLLARFFTIFFLVFCFSSRNYSVSGVCVPDFHSAVDRPHKQC